MTYHPCGGQGWMPGIGESHSHGDDPITRRATPPLEITMARHTDSSARARRARGAMRSQLALGLLGLVTVDGWSTMPPMPEEKYGAASGQINGIIYIVGGEDGPTSAYLSLFLPESTLPPSNSIVCLISLTISVSSSPLLLAFLHSRGAPCGAASIENDVRVHGRYTRVAPASRHPDRSLGSRWWHV